MRKSSVPLCGTELFFTVSLVPPVRQTQPPQRAAVYSSTGSSFFRRVRNRVRVVTLARMSAMGSAA